MKKIWDYATSKKPLVVDFSLIKTEIINDKLFVKYDNNYIVSDVVISFKDSCDLDCALLKAFFTVIDSIIAELKLKPRTLKLLRNFSRGAEETEEPKLLCTVSKSTNRNTPYGVYTLLRIAKQSYYEKWGWVNHDIDLDLKKHYNLFESNKNLFNLCVIIEASNDARTFYNLEDLEKSISNNAKELMKKEEIRISNQYQ